MFSVELDRARDSPKGWIAGLDDDHETEACRLGKGPKVPQASRIEVARRWSQGPKVRSDHPGQPEGLARLLFVQDSRTEGPQKLVQITDRQKITAAPPTIAAGPKVRR